MQHIGSVADTLANISIDSAVQQVRVQLTDYNGDRWTKTAGVSRSVTGGDSFETLDLRNRDIIDINAPSYWKLNTMSNGYTGQIVTLIVRDANTRIGLEDNIELSGGVEWTPAPPSGHAATIRFIYDGAAWQEISRSVN
jgi:hypothetical protein